MTDDDMAALHARCFKGAPRPWSAAEFGEYRSDPQVLVRESAGGLIVARIVAGEAEILTLAVDPAFRRQGKARALLAGAESAMVRAGAKEVFLEVRDDNLAARALYDSAGYSGAGYRKNYYRAAGRESSSAIVLKKRLA